MNPFSHFILLTLFSLQFHSLQAGWLERKADGWFWYEDKEKQLERKQDQPATVDQPSSHILTATEEMAAIRKELEERLSEAILRPTDQNLTAYMQLQQHWVNQSSQFSKVWVKSLLNNPQLDSRVTEFPVTQYGVQVQKRIVKENKENLIKSLVENYGLFFFYEGNSKTSQAFSFVVKEFSKKYGWQVAAISFDGILLQDFENSQSNNGIVQKLGIETFPSLFLVEPKQHMVIPIAFGLSSLDQIENNIEIQLQGQLKD